MARVLKDSFENVLSIGRRRQRTYQSSLPFLQVVRLQTNKMPANSVCKEYFELTNKKSPFLLLFFLIVILCC